jgi:MFS family permease
MAASQKFYFSCAGLNFTLSLSHLRKGHRRMTATTGQAVDARLTPAARRSVTGGIISLFVDSYDIYLPAFVLPAVTAYFEPASMPVTLQATLVTVIFTVTLLGRPIGGLIFGNLGDKIGRRKVTLIAAAGFTVTTLLIASMPGYAQWGYSSIGILIALRLIDGIFLGGGYSGPVPLAIERSPRHLRGLAGGLVAAGAPFAVLVISIIQLTVLKQFTPAALLSWGWRLPFLFGVLLGIGYIAYYWRVPEVDLGSLEATREPERAPLFQLFFRKKNARPLLQVFLLMLGLWFAAQIMVSFLPTLLITVLGQNPSDVSTLEIVLSIAGIAGMIGYGALSQKIGRRRLLIWAGASVLIGESLAYAFMVMLAEAHAGFLPVAIMALLGSVLVNAPLGCIIVYLNERFPAGVRSSGYSTAYTVALILPALYSVWLGALAHVMPYAYTGLVLIVIGGVLYLVAPLLGPETRDAELLVENLRPAVSTERAARRPSAS